LVVAFAAFTDTVPRMSDDEGFAELIFGIVLGVGVGARAIILIAAIFFDVFPPLPFGR
jgi:hypothetical protein